MASGSPNESTASRLQRIGRRSDGHLNDRQAAPDDFHIQDNNVAHAAELLDDQPQGAMGEVNDQEVVAEYAEADSANEQLEANCTDLEPDSSDEAKNVTWGDRVGSQGEPSNFSVSLVFKPIIKRY